MSVYDTYSGHNRTIGSPADYGPPEPCEWAGLSAEWGEKEADYKDRLEEAHTDFEAARESGDWQEVSRLALLIDELEGKAEDAGCERYNYECMADGTYYED